MLLMEPNPRTARASRVYNEVYNERVQLGLINMLLSDQESFSICRSILDANYFDDTLRPAIRFMLRYAETYDQLPSVEQVIAHTGVSVAKFSEGSLHSRYLTETIEQFCQY